MALVRNSVFRVVAFRVVNLGSISSIPWTEGQCFVHHRIKTNIKWLMGIASNVKSKTFFFSRGWTSLFTGAKILLNVVMKSRRKVFFCSVICRAGDSNHFFTLQRKNKERPFNICRPILILRYVMGQSFAQLLVKETLMAENWIYDGAIFLQVQKYCWMLLRNLDERFFFCTIIWSAGDSYHSFTLSTKIKFNFVRQLIMLWYVMRQLYHSAVSILSFHLFCFVLSFWFIFYPA